MQKLVERFLLFLRLLQVITLAARYRPLANSYLEDILISVAFAANCSLYVASVLSNNKRLFFEFTF